MPHVLLVEDETAIADTVLYALRAEGFEASHCLTGGEALRRARAQHFDLAVLDVGLPDIGGFALCRELRREADLPVIFLTAQGAEADRLLGLEIGADDYVTKPFSPRELVARVRVVLRRVTSAETVAAVAAHSGGAPSGVGVLARPLAAAGAVVAGAFQHDPEALRIRYHGRLLDLTRYEYGLLATLLQRPDAVLSRAQLMDRVWGDALDSGDRTVDTHIKTLRGKLRDIAPGADPIRTHRGLGYSLQLD